MRKRYRWQSDEKIIEETGMENLPEIIEQLYEKYHGEYELVDIGNDCMFRFGKTNVANVSYLATFIHFIRIDGSSMNIEGNISWPACILKQLHFYVECNEKRYECALKDRDLSLKRKGKSYEARDVFDITIPLDSYQLNEIVFVYECNGIRAESGKINSMRFVPVADLLPDQYAYLNGWLIKIKNAHILVEICDENNTLRELYEHEFCSHVAETSITKLRQEYFKRIKQKSRQIWLFMDRLEKADDNGEAFFRYVSGRKDCVAESYFIISKKSPDYERLKRYGNVVEAMSKEHFLLLFLADYIFSSQLNGWVENPFMGKEEYFRDIYHNAKVVFLQHGVTKDNHTRWLNRYRQNLYGIVVSSKYEEKSFRELPYYYDEKNIWNVLMPRFDLLYKKEAKYILVMPTWRKEIMEQKFFEDIGAFRWVLRKNKKNSNYILVYRSLLNDNKFRKLCHSAGYEVLFMAHPLMQEYVDLFHVPEDVKILPYSYSWRDIFAESALMITDYSSVAFDYAYLDRPVIYYQFDKKAFFEKHSYSQGYFDYEKMGFGPVAKNKKQLLNQLMNFLKNDCKISEQYGYRVTDFFTSRDNNNCQRLYTTVLNLAGEQNN